MSSRTVVLHYHLFKNAGTSLDHILKANFQDRWVTKEFPMAGQDNSADLANWIKREESAVAFSTHTGVGPIPQIAGVRVVSIMLLRNPIARIESAYKFERQQQVDNFGANLAKEVDFETYVRTRLDLPNDRQCRNFHVSRLATMVPGTGSELERARKAADQLTVLGSVSQFDRAVGQLADALKQEYPDFAWQSVRANVSKGERAVNSIKEPFLSELYQVNADDIRLINERFPEEIRSLNHA